MAKAGSLKHTIKVQQLEAAVRTAAAAQRNTPVTGKDRETKTKAVQKLATKLLAARLQVLRSRIAEVQPKSIPDRGLRLRMTQMQAGGVNPILAEFGGLVSD